MSRLTNWFNKPRKESIGIGTPKDWGQVKRTSRPNPLRSERSGASSKFHRDEKKVPPVLVRGDLLGTPMVKKVKRSPRRKVRLPLQAKGVELSLPALPRIHVGWRAFSAVIAVIMAVLLFILWSSPEYKVQAAQIDGLKNIDSQEVNSILDIEGKPIFEIDPANIKRTLDEKFPEFREIMVEVSLPAEVYITVKEREAVIVWNQNERTTLIDKDGIGFPARKKANGLMVIQADEPPFLTFDSEAEQHQFLPRESIQAILQLAKIVPSGVPIRFDKTHGLGWDDPAGWKVYFGSDFENIEQKILIYQAILGHIQGNGIVPTLISVEYLDAPYYHVE